MVIRVENSQLYVYNTQTLQQETIDFKDVITSKLSDEINSIANRLGVELTVSSIKRCEDFVSSYYAHLGYDIINLTKVGMMQHTNVIIIHSKWVWGEIEKLGYDDSLFRSGIPDLLIYNENKKEYFFVEVKSMEDSLRLPQLDWIFKYHKILVKIVFTEQINHGRYY